MRSYQRYGFVLALVTRLDDLKSGTIAAVNSLDEDTLRGVWDEFNYRLGVIFAASGGQIEQL